MDIERATRFHTLIEELLELEPSERPGLLDRECGSDLEMRRDLEQVLEAEAEELDSFFEPPSSAANDDLPESVKRPLPASLPPSSTSITRPTTGKLTTSIQRRLRASGAVPLLFALLLVMPLLVGAAALGTSKLLSAADPHFTFGSWTGNLGFVDPEVWPDLRSGDQLLKIHGQVVEGETKRLRAALLGLEAGPVEIEVRRFGAGGETQTIRAKGVLEAFSLTETAIGWSRLMIGVILLFIAFGALVLSPESSGARLLLVFCVSLAAYLLVYLAFLPFPREALLLEKLSLYLTVGTSLHLYAAYPRGLFSPRWTPLFYLPFAVAVLFGMLYRSPWAAVTAQVIQLAPHVALIASVFSFSFALRQIRRARADDDTVSVARGRAVVVGLAALTLSVIFDVLPIIESSIAWMFYSTLVLVFAGVVGYSIVRHNALDIDRFTAALVGYGGTTLILAAFSGGFVIGVPSLLGREFDSPITTAVISGGCFLIFQPLHRRLRKRIDRLFLRQERDQGVEVRLLNRLSSAVRVRELPQAFKAALETLEILGASRLELWARAPGGTAFSRVAASLDEPPALDSFPFDGPLGDALKNTDQGGGVESLVDLAFEEAAQEELWQLGLAMAAPIATEDRLEGFIGAGRKENGTAFHERDRHFLEAVGAQLAIAMDRNWQRAQRVGSYVLQERLGTGGMAEVFLAEKLGPGGFGRRVAMKRILPHLAHESDAVAMFLDEARFAARLHHPNIVQIYDIEEHEGVYYLSMELLDGPSVKTWIRAAKERPELMPLEAAMAVAEALLSALEHVHSRVDDRGEAMGLVHRDVKPANLLTGREGDIKLGDFGIARAEFRLYQTSPGMSRGTPPFMAPEVLAGEEATPQSDLFAAAAVLFETLSFKTAFERGPLESQRPEMPERFEPEVHRRLEIFFDHALAMEPTKRFLSARTMLDAFMGAVSPVHPSPRRHLAELLEKL